MNTPKPIIIGTRGSALALAQAHTVFDLCRAAFPRLKFELKIIKTTGDKLQTASMSQAGASLPKGLFTKELEVALVKGRADLAVHSLKDLPTDLPAGLTLGATLKRADVRDVLIYRDAAFIRARAAATTSSEWSPGQDALRGFAPKTTLRDLPAGALVATSSTRRRAQILALRPDLKTIEIRGNLPTRLQKLAERAEMDATVLALAGMTRLRFSLQADGRLEGDAVPDGLLAAVLDVDEVLPCVGQGAIGIEVRAEDERLQPICARLNHYNTFQCVTAERAFLAAMGGGCQSPVGAYAEPVGAQIHFRAVSFAGADARRASARRGLKEPVALGEEVAAKLKG